MNQFMSIQKKTRTASGVRLRIAGAIGLAVIFFSLIGYMIKTNEVNFITGGLVVLTGLFSGIAWGDILNEQDKQ